MDDSEDPQLLLKQETLKKEIIDKNYDRNKFILFCLTKKENGDDLANWSLLELNNVIVEFITEQQKEGQNNNITSASSTSSSNNGFNANDIQVNIERLKILKSIEEQLRYEKEITCKRLEKTALNDKEATVVLKNPKISGSTLFESSHVSYEVVTESLQWIVSRRYSDFDWLRAVLCKCFPRLVVPPLPGKKLGGRRFEPDFIEKRMGFLQKFIDAIMINESFKTSEALVAFLSMIDRGQFESKMKEMTTYQPSPYVEDSRTLTGVITVVDDANNEKYYMNISEYFRLQTQLYERLNYNMKGFYVNMSQACINLDEVQKDFETMHLLNTRVLMKEDITKAYQELGIFFKNWKRILFNQNEIFKTRIKNFFKYLKMEGVAYSELILSREAVKVKYVAEESRVNAKKEKLWQSMDISKWEISDEFNKIDKVMLMKDKSYALRNMCTKDSQSLENLHQQLGYANKMNMEELKKMIDVNTVRFGDNMKAFAEEFYPSLTDGINVWSTLNRYL